MFRRIALLASLFAVVVGGGTTSQAASQFSPLTRINNLTFSKAAALPGVTLTPGTYTFEAGPANSNPNVVRVSRNRQTVFIGMTIPAIRAQDAEASLVTFGEAVRGEVTPILVWYPGGSTQGHQFLYR
jgi:hypothetical protein